MKKYLSKNDIIYGIINPSGVSEKEKRELYDSFPNATFMEKRIFDVFFLRYITTEIYMIEDKQEKA